MWRGVASRRYRRFHPAFGTQDPGLIFELPLSDAGSGAVLTTPTVAGGSPTPTFTRATVAWTKLSSGLWASVASGTARYSYLGADTAVGAAGGYFAEGAGTQLVTPTASIRDMTNAAWTAGATMTVALDGVGIDGAANSCSRLTGGAVSATNTIFQTLVAAASSRTYSVWLKRVTGTGVINITQDGGVGYTDVTSQINSSTFTRVSLTASQLNAAFGIQVVTSGDVILADFNQFEPGAFATSPMAAAGVARNADALSFPSAGNMVASGSPETWYVEAQQSQLIDSTSCALLDTDSNYRFLGVQVNAVPYGYHNAAATLIAAVDAMVAGVVSKIAARYDGSNFQLVSDGSAGSAQAMGAQAGAATSLYVGYLSGGTTQLFGTIRNLRIYSTALTAAQLQAMTT